jgi:disulfide oxidoreductase YuzD
MEGRMEPVTTSIVTALVTGAVASLKPTVSRAVKDGYERLKALIKRKYSKVSIDQLEADPTSKARRAVVEEDLQKTDAEKDPELLQQVKALLDAIQSQPPEVVSAVGVDLEEIKGASLTIRDVTATGTAVKAKQVETSGDILIEGIRGGRSGEAPPN